MTDIIPIRPLITAAGLAAARDAKNGGFKVNLTHVAIGDGAGVGYGVGRDQTALRRELVRAAFGGGQETGPNTVALSAIIGPGDSFPIREVGFFAGNTLFAVWSDNVELADRPSRASLVLGLALTLIGVPPNTVSVSLSGLNLSIMLASPLTNFALAITQLQGRALAQDCADASAAIRSTHR